MNLDERSAGRCGWLDQAGLDIRLAGRLLVKHAAFTTVTVITLALAIGVNTAITANRMAG